jgi:NAD(P)-dependent dehydrogenase (short-subunit alcohol dehydrogenase family)
MGDLTGRSAIITGANRGLGRVMAEHFVRAGASVLLAARDAKLLDEVHRELSRLTKGDQKVLAIRTNVASETACVALAAKAIAELPNFCILVNNAAVHGAKGMLEEVDWDEWVQTIQINLLAPVYLSRCVIPHFKKLGHGKIINLSGGGATSPMPRVSAYAASKAALVRTTETLAVELKDSHVDVNAIAPGAMNTRMLDEVLNAGPEVVGEEMYRKSLKQRDEGGAPPEKAAALAVFLASSDSDGISGRLISAVWDDWQNLPSKKEQLAKSDVFTLRRIVPEDRGMK